MSAGRGPVVGAVLVGGSSRRMGQTKALIRVKDAAMGRLVADALNAGGCQRVVAVGGERSVAADLWLDPLEDRWPGLGPLGGIATAVLDADLEAPGWGVRSTPADRTDLIVVVAACDTPDLGAELVHRLIGALRAAPPEVVAAAPVTPDGRRHPLPSAWRATVGPQLEHLVSTGALRADAVPFPEDVAEGSAVVRGGRADAGFALGAVVDVDATSQDLRDIDTPEDLHGNPGPSSDASGPLTWGPPS